MQITLEQARIVVPRLLAQQALLPAGEQRWQVLSAAHIAGQNDLALHLHVHLAMLRLAWQQRHAGEFLGQLMRLALVPLGHAFERLPAGNSGRSNVSAFQPMVVSDEMQRYVRDALHK
jgi:hypothetical protein